MARLFSEIGYGLLLSISLSSMFSCSDSPPIYGYRVINTYNHDRDAFTQGLVFHGGFLYESTGINGRSSLRKVDIETGEVLQIRRLPSIYFGEGIAIFGDRIIQLTWKSGTGFVYDLETFELLKEFRYPNEGWGITHDGQRLIVSDGSSKLHYLDPETFERTGHLDVYDSRGPVDRLNELEYVKGEIYANIWLSDRIARISPETGGVTGWIDLEGLLQPEDIRIDRPVDVLNGIGHDPERDRLFVTGKLWPKVFEIALEE
jgi:glutamine cyclotransferase